MLMLMEMLMYWKIGLVLMMIKMILIIFHRLPFDFLQKFSLIGLTYSFKLNLIL